MGMAACIHILNGRKIEGDRQDCRWLWELAPQLDVVCQRRGVRKLSDYFDCTDLEYNMDEESGPDPELDPETGWPWGIDDLSWFPARDGLRTFRELSAAVREGVTVDGLLAGREDDLLDELDGCARQLEAPAELGQMFHLSVLM